MPLVMAAAYLTPQKKKSPGVAAGALHWAIIFGAIIFSLTALCDR